MKQYGYVTMRNEDGTQYLGVYVSGDGANSLTIGWTPEECDRTFVEEGWFLEYFTKERVEASRKDDCPDNGFWGLYNLRFHPVTKEEMEILAKQDAAHRDELDKQLIMDSIDPAWGEEEGEPNE